MLRSGHAGTLGHTGGRTGARMLARTGARMWAPCLCCLVLCACACVPTGAARRTRARRGAYLFESLLIDYDVCSNWGNWVAAAGLTGGRINLFNITKQASGSCAGVAAELRSSSNTLATPRQCRLTRLHAASPPCSPRTMTPTATTYARGCRS